MRKPDQRGSVVSIIMIVFSVIALIGLAAFGGWAYMSRQDYKDNVDTKIAEAVDAARKDEQAKKDIEFAEREKQPFTSYTGPSTAGSIKLTYPKTWSAYIDESGSGNMPINGYFYPGFVPNVIDRDVQFPLQVQVKNATYDDEMHIYETLINSGAVKASPFRAAQVQSVLGIRLDGKYVQGNDKIDGSLVILPLRDKTIEISTQTQTYMADFNDTVLANLTFVP